MVLGRAEVESLVSEALESAEAAEVRGKRVTPFLLEHLAKRSAGRTLKTNIAQEWSKDRKSTRLNSSHLGISYAVFCLKKKTQKRGNPANLKLIAQSAHDNRTWRR